MRRGNIPYYSKEEGYDEKGIGSFLFCGSCYVAAFTVQPGPVTAAETFTLKAISAWPKSAVEYKAWTTWVDMVDQMVAKKYPGELKIQYLGGPEAVKTPDQAPALQRGQFDILYTSGAYYTDVLPEIDALKLSNLYSVRGEDKRGSGIS